MTIVDFHAHIFPERIVGAAMQKLHDNSKIKQHLDGSVSALREYNKENGISKSVILNIATNQKQQNNMNNFAKETDSEDIIAFGSVHPFAPDALDELERIAEMGLRGIKLHPDYQDFYADDERVFPVYEKAAELGLITVFHSGLDLGCFDPIRCTPKRLAEALPVFGGAPVVAAHFGAFMLWFDVEKYLVGKDVYFDTSYCYSRMPPGLASRIIENHGYERILFGSDTPWSPPADEFDFIHELGFNEKVEAAIFGGNALRLLNL